MIVYIYERIYECMLVNYLSGAPTYSTSKLIQGGHAESDGIV